jgi:hypothetical protein
MGVDIYLESIFDAFMKAQPQELPNPTADPKKLINAHFDLMRSSGGYFRNGYNHGDIMHAMGLSWRDTVSPMLNDHEYLPIASARELLAMIEERPITREHVAVLIAGEDPHPEVTMVVAQVAHEHGVQPKSDQPPNIDEHLAFLNERRGDLLALLRKSIELDEPLSCSL